MPTTVTHELEVGEAEIRGATDLRHRVILPDWDLIELDALGDRIPPAPPLAWEGPGLMLAGMGDDAPSEPEDADWELVELLDPDEDDLEPVEDLIEWPSSEDDWDVEELEAIGDSPAEPEPSPWSGTELMAAGLVSGLGGDGASGDGASSISETPVDDDWELESLALADQNDIDDETDDEIDEDEG